VRDRPLIRTADEIARIRAAALVVHDVLAEIERLVAPGLTTADIDRLAEARLRERGALPAFKGYHGFPATICISVNDEVVHGIPSDRRRLEEGDIVSLDFGAVVDGWYGDAAVTVPVGQVEPEALRLVETTREALARAVDAVRPGGRVGDIGAAVQRFVEGRGMAVVRDFVGHGIGKSLHEPPHVPNFGTPGTGALLREGMVLAIEPMVTAGGAEVITREDGWTAVTADGSLAAHFEHTVAVTSAGPVVLSFRGALPPSGNAP
jgi:methionyl aminopeptidase